MSNYKSTEPDDDKPRSSNKKTDNNYTKINLDQANSFNNCILEVKSPESIRETVNSNTEVLHTFAEFNPLKRNSVTVLGTTIYTNKSYSPLSLNFVYNKPVKSNKHGNAGQTPLIGNTIFKSLNKRKRKSLANKNCDSKVQPSCSTKSNELVIKYCEQNKYATFNLSKRDPRLKNYYKHKYEQRFINLKGLKQSKYNKKPYLNKNSGKINRKLKNINSCYNVGVSKNSDSLNNFNEQNIEGIKEFHVNKIEFDYTQNDVGSKGCIKYNKVMKHVNTEQNQKNSNVLPLIDLTNDDEEVVNCINSYNSLKNDCELKNVVEVSLESEEKKIKHVVANIIDNSDDSITLDSNSTKRIVSQKNQEIITTHNLNEQIKNNVKTVKKNILTLENSIFDNTQQTAGDNISGLIETDKNSKQIRSIEHSTTESIEKHIDFTYGRNVTVDLNENLNFNTALITKKQENPKRVSMVNVSKDEDKFIQSSKNSKRINNEENSVINQHEKSKKSKKSKYNKDKNKSPKHNKYSKIHKNKTSSKIDSNVLKTSDLVTIDTQSNDEQVNYKKMTKKLIKQIIKTNKNEIRYDPDKIIQFENKADNIDKNHVENASELIENNQCGFDSMEIVFNEPCVEVKSNSNIFTENVLLATNVSEETHSLKPNTVQSLSNYELYNILSDVVEEEQNIECSKQILKTKSPEIQDANESCHDSVYIRVYEELSKLENSGDSKDKKSSATMLQDTTADETRSNEPFKNATIFSKDHFIDNGKPDGLKQSKYNKKPYLNKNSGKINRKLKNINSCYNVGVSKNSDSLNNFNEQNIEGIKEFHVNKIEFDYTQNDVGSKGCIKYNKVMKHVNTEQNQKNSNVLPLIDLTNDDEEVVNCINSYNSLKNDCELKNVVEVSLESEEKKIKHVVANIIDNSDDSITLDSNSTKRIVSQKNQEIITTHNLNEQIKNNVKTVKKNILTLENSIFDNTQQTAGDNISGLIETDKNSKQIRSIEHSTTESIEKHIDFTYGRNVTVDLNENLNFNTALITKKQENPKRVSMVNVSKDEDKFIQSSKNSKRINNEENSVINQHEKSKKSKKSKYNKDKNKSPKHNKYSKIHKNKTSSKIDSNVLKTSDLVTIDTQSNDEQVNYKKMTKKLIKQIIKTNKNEIRYDPDKIIQFENKADNIDKNHVENASELIENNQCGFDSMEIVFNEPCVEVKSNSNIFTENVLLATNVSEETHSLKPNTVQSLSNYELYNILSDVVEEEQNIECSKQILKTKSPEIQDANESCHDSVYIRVYEELSKLENSGDSKDKKSSATMLQDTTADETRSNEPFKNATIFSKDHFIDNGKPDGLKQSKYNKKPYLNKNSGKINRKLKNINSCYNVGVSKNSDSLNNFNEQNIEGIKEFHVNKIEFDYTQNDVGSKGCIKYNKVMKHVNTEQNQKNSNVLPLIDLTNDDEEVVNCINSYNSLKNDCELKNVVEVSLESEEKKIKHVVANIIDNSDDSITLDSNSTKRIVSQKNQEIITTHNLNEQIKNNVKTVKKNILTLENSIFDNTQQTAGDNISGLIETDKNSKQIRSIEHSTTESIEKHIDFTYGRNVTVDLNENLNFNTALITKKQENPKRVSMVNVSKDEDKFIQSSKNSKRINNEENSVINQHEKSKKSKKSKYNKDKNKSPKHNKYSKIHKNKTSSKIDSNVLKTSDLVTIDTQSNDEQVNYKKMTKKLIKQIIKTNKNEIRYDPDKIIQFENKADNIDKNHVENASELIENNQCGFDSMEIVFNEPCVEVKSNSNIFTENVLLATNVSEETHSLKPNTVQSLSNYELYNILSDVVEEEQNIECSKQILKTKSPEIQDANESCHDSVYIRVYEELSKLENSGDSKDKKSSATMLQDTTADETRSNEPFKNATIFSKDHFIDNGKPDETTNTFQTNKIGILPYLNKLVVDTLNSSDAVVENKNINIRTQNTDHILFSKWDDIKILSYVVESKLDVCLKSGQQIINSSKSVHRMPYHFVDTSYCKNYFRKLKCMLSNDVKSKWLRDKKTTLADQLCLYKCSGKNCNRVFSNQNLFRNHLNHHHSSNLESPHFMKCMYCFKQFDNESISELGNHIMENYTFCKYFCRYCLYRAYTASHVLVHEYIFHKDQQPSIIKFKNRQGTRREVVMAIDFNKFVLRYVCNIGCCTFSTYTNTDFLSHLIMIHALCDEFYCDLCSHKNDNKYVCSNPELFVKHFSLHNINTYQCIFCLFGARNINVMLIHLAMEHFEYEPLCLERCPKSKFCNNRNIKNLKILNIQKYVTDKIIEVLAPEKNDHLQECQTIEMNEKCKIDETGESEDIDEVDNTPQVMRKFFKKFVQPSKNKSTVVVVDNENDMIILSDEAKNDQRDAQPIQNVKASIVNDKKNKSQLSNYDLINNFELENDIEIQINKKHLKTQSSKKPTDQPKNYRNGKLNNESAAINKLIKVIDEVFPDGLSYEDHLHNCPLENSKECTFCLAQSNATFEVKKLVEPNRFTCTFCNLKLPSVTISRQHVRKEHHILNFEFIPVDINSNNIKKDRFLVCQYKSLKRKKLYNDCILLTESDKSTTTVSKTHSDIVNKHNDFQLTKSPNTLYNSKQNTRRSRDESKEQHKVLNRKHSTKSCNVSLNAELHSGNKQKIVDKYIQSTQYNSFNVPEALASVAEPSTTIAGFKELPPVKHTNMDEHVPSTQYNTLSVPKALANVFEPSTTIAVFKELPPVKQTNVDEHVPSTQCNMFNISNALTSVAELSKTIAGFKDLQPTNKKKNVDQHIPSTQISMFNISEALDSVAELLATIARFKDLPPANKQTNVDEHVPSTQCNTLNVPEALASITESSTMIAGFKDLQPTNKQKNVDQHISSIQNSMFNFPEALDCVTELLSTIAGFKEIPIKSTSICSTSTKAIDVLVSEVQEKVLSYPSRNPNGYLTLIRCIGKYACPVCNVFITEKEQSFHEHLLKEINGQIWECLKCFAISDSVEKMESHVIKHTLDKRNYEKIEFCNKNIWVDRIIEYQNILIEYVRLKRNN